MSVNFKSLSPIRIGTLIVAVLALIFHVVGFATNHWLDVEASLSSSRSLPSLSLGGSSLKFGSSFNNIQNIHFDDPSSFNPEIPSGSSGANGRTNIKGYSGLWKTCSSNAGITLCKSRDDAMAMGLNALGMRNIRIVDHKWRAIQALETIGLILLVLVCVGIAISVVDERARVETVSAFLGGASLLAAACILVGVIILGQGYVLRPIQEVSWSLALSVVGGGLAFVAGLLVFICLSRERQSPTSRPSHTQGVVLDPMNHPQKPPGNI